MKEKIIKYCGRSPLVFYGEKFFLLDYSACGNDAVLITQLKLIELLIGKYFDVLYSRAYYGITELGVCYE